MPRPSRPRLGVTLLELMVTLTLLALAAALVPPLLRAPGAAADRGEEMAPAGRGALADAGPSDEPSLVRLARRQAVARAGAVRLTLSATGDWSLRALPDHRMLAAGRLAVPAAPLVLDVDALGTCSPPRRPGGTAAPAFDPLRCAAP
jgi:prepilin-type N-terminal cleavage/methylation domain-containing protein